MNKEELRMQILTEATRDELISELENFEPITWIKVNDGNGEVIESLSGNVAVDGEAHIFVIRSNKKVSWVTDNLILLTSMAVFTTIKATVKVIFTGF